MAASESARRHCRACGQDKTEEHFDVNGQGRRERQCISCKSKERRKRRPEDMRARGKRYRERVRRDRARAILADSRSGDRKRGLVGNDLDVEFVRMAIRDGCEFCGERELMMTLDRIENDTAHTKLNVRAACIRCNCLRGDMPYAAWLVLVPAVRDAREKGLFGAWGSLPIRERKRARLGLPLRRPN